MDTYIHHSNIIPLVITVYSDIFYVLETDEILCIKFHRELQSHLPVLELKGHLLSYFHANAKCISSLQVCDMRYLSKHHSDAV